MRNLKCLLLILSVSLLACKKENGSKLPVIKGIQKRDVLANPVGVDGVPNVNTGGDALDFNGPDLISYPNPAAANISLAIRSEKGATRIWMVRGRYKGGKFGPDDILGMGLYIPIDMTVDLKPGVNVVSLDLTGVRNGYYRLYVESNSVKLWDNIKVDRP